MADKLIMWDKLMRAITLVATSETIPDKETRCLSVPAIHNKFATCIRRAVKRIDIIVSSQIESEEEFTELKRLIEEAKLPVTVERMTITGKFNHGRILTPKGFILYG